MNGSMSNCYHDAPVVDGRQSNSSSSIDSDTKDVADIMSQPLSLQPPEGDDCVKFYPDTCYDDFAMNGIDGQQQFIDDQDSAQIAELMMVYPEDGIVAAEDYSGSVINASGYAGATLGLLLGGSCVAAAVAGLGFSYAASQQDDACGDIARAVGELALFAKEKIIEIDRTYQIVETTKDCMRPYYYRPYVQKSKEIDMRSRFEQLKKPAKEPALAFKGDSDTVMA